MDQDQDQDHSDIGYTMRENPKKTRRLCDREELESCSVVDEAAPAMIPKKKRTPTPAASSRWAYDKEQADVATILMMLSRDDGYPKKEKKGRYECASCDKKFRSYQALGGHMASHGRPKRLCFSESSVVTDASVEQIGRRHRCAICGKVFASGQALGGHKRTHSATMSLPAIAKPEPLDLNLPAGPVVDEDSGITAVADAEFDSWWAGSDLNMFADR